MRAPDLRTSKALGKPGRRGRVAGALCLVLLTTPSLALAAQSTEQTIQPRLAADPFESLNRKLYAFNDVLDGVLFRPVTQTYRRVLPRPVRHSVHNVLSNLNEPIVFLNDAVQLRLSRAGHTAARFASNTTIGVLGLFDVATPLGLPHHDNSFAVTLGRAGIGAGPYLFLPGVGPTTVRDLTGSAVDLLADPLNQIRHIRSTQVERAQVVVGLIDARASNEDGLETLQDDATDPYATLRSVYLQESELAVRGDANLIESLPDLPGDAPDPGAPAVHTPPAASPPAAASPTAPAEAVPSNGPPAPTVPPQGS